MIKISQIKLDIRHTEQDLRQRITKLLKMKPVNGTYDFDYKIQKQSIDARHEDVKYIYTVLVSVKNEEKIVKKINNKNIMLTKEEFYEFVPSGTRPLSHSPVVVGSGPAGLFCAYMLAEQGYRPVIIERGEPVEQRMETVEHFFETGELNPESNVQFGEGGAGTFSDGKLNTLVKDKQHRNDLVLETFVAFGAEKSITYVNKPHIGTDCLSVIVKNMREHIISMGGTFRFSTRFQRFKTEEGALTAVEVTLKSGEREWIPAEVCVLATGHSARDTFQMLYEQHVCMEPKAFAVGVRVEHSQDRINESQYGKNKDLLPAASYKLAKTAENGRGVYSFCMCPGGYVVNASSEPEHLAVNGMSYSQRDGVNANSAIVVSVTPDDFEDRSPLGGIEFQRKLEAAAYREGKGKIPVQTYQDFKRNKTTTEFGRVVPGTKGGFRFGNLRNILPEYICQSLIEGIDSFDRQIQGYANGDTVLSGVESRTSSPLRILRNENLESNYSGIYPCGDGAGYAGGITSAAMDGIRVYEAIASKYCPLT